MHQPPNPEDLRRAPPAGRECAWVRGLLRDFADGDLAAGEHRKVEEHVHACFACSVELSRAEHEVLRLRRGFARMAMEEQARGLRRRRPDFAARVVDAIVDATLPAVGDEAPAKGAGAAPLSAPGEHGFLARGQVALVRHRRTLLLAFGLLLGAFVGLAMWVVSGEQQVDRNACLVVQSARDAFGDTGRLFVGDGLGERGRLKVGRHGSAKVDWHDASQDSQPAATLAMSGEGRMRLEKGVPVLEAGSLTVETNRPVTIPVADGSEIELGVGTYTIVAEVSVASEDYQSQLLDPMSGAPADLRIQVEVLRGDDAQIVRPEVGPTLIAAGGIGIYQGNSTVAVVGGGAQLAGGDPVGVSGGSAAAGPAEPPKLLASVYQRSGLPSVGTHVVAIYPTNGGTHFSFGISDAYGKVVMASEEPCLSSFAVLHALPQQLAYGMVAPDAFPLVRDGANVRAEQSIVLDLAEPVRGQVVDVLDQPVLGVRVVPCIVDELLGHVYPVPVIAESSDDQGRFTVRRFAPNLPQHQHLALVLAHPEFSPLVVPVPVRGSANALLPMAPVVLKRLHSVVLDFGVPHADITLWEDIEGLATRAVWQRQFHADHHGKVWDAAVGEGLLWRVVGSGNNMAVTNTNIGFAGPFVTVGLGGSSPVGAQFRPLQNLPGTDLYLASSVRHQRIDTSTGGARALIARDSLGRVVANAQVFATSPTGPRGTVETRFLGLTSSQGMLTLGAFGGENLLVLGADGAFATVPQSQQSGLVLSAQLQPTGRVLLGETLRPGAAGATVVRMRFRRQFTDMPEGMEVVAERFASEATGWEVAGLVPGFYMVELGNVSLPVQVPPGGFAVLQ
ncbi:MAG: zf-HC2 domain-containing protein [Planctomycetes bacterium]|nr:zf-HC2 domain-containing protein [Planctomycetota bacterium]